MSRLVMELISAIAGLITVLPIVALLAFVLFLFGYGFVACNNAADHVYESRQ